MRNILSTVVCLLALGGCGSSARTSSVATASTELLPAPGGETINASVAVAFKNLEGAAKTATIVVEGRPVSATVIEYLGVKFTVSTIQIDKAVRGATGLTEIQVMQTGTSRDLIKDLSQIMKAKTPYLLFLKPFEAPPESTYPPNLYVEAGLPSIWEVLPNQQLSNLAKEVPGFTEPQSLRQAEQIVEATPATIGQ